MDVIEDKPCELFWLCWLVYVNLTQTRDAWEEGTYIGELPASLWACFGSIFLIND